MPLNLAAPLRWKSANFDELKALRGLQGNILKGHGRSNTWNIFFQLGTGSPAAIAASKQALREIANYHVTDAHAQLLANEAFKANHTDGGTFCALALSAKGYQALGIAFAPPAGNAAYNAGMKTTGTVNDPAPTDWEAPFQQRLDGMVLVGDDDETRGKTAANEVVSMLTAAGATVHHTQLGHAVLNKVGVGIEHFGYVDGRSQPLLLAEDIEQEARSGGTAEWDPTFPLASALVRDPGSADPNAFGSFFIFRKLEQDVRGFKTLEQDLADALSLIGEARERAGAQVVGRFEDGSPVTMSDEAKGRTPPNDFNYQGSDSAGSRCPFHAHIRKVNPRNPGALNAGERAHIMPRRGIPFTDVPRIDPNALPEVTTRAAFDTLVKPMLPTGGVGLLFMAYNAKLDDQFVFTQQTWANNLGFPQPGTGLDPVIGQPAATAGGQTYHKEWDNLGSQAVPFNFGHFVKMKGGEYFFAPSLIFLRSL